ncbi:MAG: pimeloyl-ACP methyl ester carboxylesterase [Pseudohongiellaceae bacterium]|jgi:pimeloyl-ACP methyl ester carboxylesterase
MKRKSVYALAGFIVAIPILISSCISFEMDANSLVDNQGLPIKENWANLKTGTLHYIQAGDPNGTPIVFIHGTPGSLRFFASYVTDPQLQDYRTIAIDRPGWGSSEIIGEFEPTLSYQSRALGEWLCEVKQQSATNKLVVVAHSYGATLTPKLVMDHPDCISGAVLLAGAADPELAAPRWYNNITHYTPVSWLVSLTSMGLKKSNDEMMEVKSELEAIRHSWGSINLPITVIQGEEDGLVHPDNADFIETELAHIPAKVIRINGGGHVLRSSHKDLIVNEINSLL